jgi:hypothetical protein
MAHRIGAKQTLTFSVPRFQNPAQVSDPYLRFAVGRAARAWQIAA